MGVFWGVAIISNILEVLEISEFLGGFFVVFLGVGE